LSDALSRNLEWKARYVDLATGQEAVRHLGADHHGREVQTDTFFHVPAGRFKLREIDGEGAHLIWYDRPDREGARLSRYYLVPVVDAARMKAALSAAMGIRGVVRKDRVIYLWRNVRIHFDEVAGLGAFVEAEAVLADGDEISAPDRLAELVRVLAIPPANFIAGAYADLLEL
jgi:predicted adenylyl cyclase CyaB